MPFRESERKEIYSNCTSFLVYRPALFAEMIQEVANSPYADLPHDSYGKGGFVADFEREVAQVMGKESTTKTILIEF